MIRAAFLAGLLFAGVASAEPQITHLRFDDLREWQSDDHDDAMVAFRESCDRLQSPDWDVLCSLADEATDAKSFFELFFQPVSIDDGDPALFTGYFEPELRGSKYRSAAYPYPVYRMPPEARTNRPWLTRRQIETGGAMSGRGLAIAYVSDPVDLFFLQVQGSGRIRLDSGGTIRVGYGGSNGRPYTSIGQRLVARGHMQPHEASAANIRAWVRKNPVLGLDLLRETQGYVFFRVVEDVSSEKGPLGAMQRSLTALRTVAVDPEYVPLGAPVWIEKDGATPMNQLMIAQDTGSKIKGAQRVDIFFGFGSDAGRAAGRIRDGGRVVVLLPIQRAFDFLPERLE